SAPAVLIQGSSVNVALGPTTFGGFGFVNRGDVRAYGVYDGITATALRFEGLGGFTVDTAGGVTNDRLIEVSTREADAFGVSVGDGVTIPLLRNRLNLLSSVTSEGADTAYAVFIEGGTVSAFNNSGIVAAELFGETGNAVAIIDTSNTLATITNSGTIVAQIIATDDDLSDNVVPTVTGDSVAIDVSASTIGVTLNQIADTPFTDDDTTDDDVDNRPDVRILGDIRFGSGADTFNLLDGLVEGDLSFGAGLDTFLIDNGAIYSGILSDSGGGLNITVNDGLLDLRGAVGGVVNITNATFSADSELRLNLDETPVDSTLIQATGTVTFAPGAVITPFIPTGLPENGTIVFLTAGSLVGGANVVNPALSGDNVPFVYNLAIELTNPLAADGAANGLQAEFGLKSAAQLGLNINQAIAFDPIIAALRLDADATAAFLTLDNQAEFDDAYEDLMPSFSSAAAELAATAIQQAQGASGNRLAATRLQGIDEVSVWAQEIGYFVSRTPPSLEGQEFTGHGFGMAIGIDGPLDNGALFGLSASFITSEVEEEGRPEGELSATFGQVSAYLGAAAGIVDLDFVAGVGVGQMNSQRFVQIGEDFEAITEAEWWAYEGHGMARASIPLSFGDSWVITPQAALTYVFLVEDGYTEEGGGPAIDYDVDGVTSQRLW
ncbi:MAG: autotransporter domain-containing protein, partial [Hyphomonadaceae bacterium]|nr:autotransporter domain-containing protein [Hyphomonadaceae bacterium]